MNASYFRPNDFKWRDIRFDSLEALIAWSRENPTYWVSLSSDPEFYYANGIRYRMADGAVA